MIPFFIPVRFTTSVAQKAIAVDTSTIVTHKLEIAGGPASNKFSPKVAGYYGLI